MTYENCVVLKPWGYEFKLFDNGKISIWMLNIEPGQGTSVHCHFSKCARFIPIAGVVVVRTNEGVHRMVCPQSFTVDRYEFHAVGNGGDEPLSLIEVETSSDKGDLFRLRDRYGRGQGYEGGDNIVREGLEKYGHFTLEPDVPVIHRGYRLSVDHDGLLAINIPGSRKVA
jgi:mannose-6-phosphate isomerase-like protein (cupin superfamily)